MVKTFVASEVVKKVEGLNTEKTLKRWTALVKDNFGEDYFKADKIPFNRKGNSRSVVVYSIDDIKKLQSVAYLMAEQATNRKDLVGTIVKVFSSDYEWIKPKTDWEVAYDCLVKKMNEMKKENTKLLHSLQDTNRRLGKTEESLEAIRSNKPKLFKQAE